MAHQIIKPYSFLLYILALINSFFIGVSLAVIFEAGKNQGLAGGAIVAGYGFIAAVLGLIISLFITKKTNRKLILRLNGILAISLVGFILFFSLRYSEQQKAKTQKQQTIEKYDKTSQI